MNLIKKNNIRKVVKELDVQGQITSIAEDVAEALEFGDREFLNLAIQRAKFNGRRTILPRDL